MGYESRPMTDKEKEEFSWGANKHGEESHHARIIRPIRETAEGREAHVARVVATERDRVAAIDMASKIKENFSGPGEGIRPKDYREPIIDENPTAYGNTPEEFGKALEEARDRAQQAKDSRTVIVEPLPFEPEIKPGFLKRLFGKK